MARLRITDELQSFRFWLVDIYPSSKFPYFALGGITAGFSSITMPEITVELDTINEFNSTTPHHEYSNSTYSNMTLSRGSRIYDSSFYNWIKSFIDGSDIVRRNLLLIHYTGVLIEKPSVMSFPIPETVDGTYLPAKFWLLSGCVPTRYKAGSDFDAKTGEVSISELDIAMRLFKEISLSQNEVGTLIEMVVNNV